MPISTTYSRSDTVTGGGKTKCRHCRREQPCGCTGLTCLCRPRFFAGQLLTEQDLNHLDRYIVEKQKLHNRYLHGWGTVCGLSVECNPCADGVVVSQGYALSPCGNDIIVCDDDAVDVCELIKGCMEQEKRDCQPPFTHEKPPCDTDTEDWILAICYNEQPSRGITSLHQSGNTCGCGNGNGCGHGSGCGCGNGNGHGGGRCTCGSHSVKPPPPQCEPTLVCETYRYAVYRAPPGIGPGNLFGSDERRRSTPGMTQAFRDCLDDLLEVLTAQPDSDNPTDGHNWFCGVYDRLWHFFATHPSATCNWRERLKKISCPSPQRPNFVAGFRAATLDIALLLVEYLFHCICEALLPPCPEPPDRDCVPLARVTVSRGDCKVQHVCNWTTERRFVMTFPTLRYWLEPLGIRATVRESLEALCCGILGLRDRIQDRREENDSSEDSEDDAETVPIGGDFANAPQETVSGRAFREGEMRFTSYPTSAIERPKRIAAMASQALSADREPLNLRQLFNGILGGKDEKGEDLISKDDREDLMLYIGLNYLAAPLIRNAVPEDLAGMTGMASRIVRSSAADFETLKAELADLRATVKQQEAQIRDLSDKSDD